MANQGKRVAKSAVSMVSSDTIGERQKCCQKIEGVALRPSPHLPNRSAITAPAIERGQKKPDHCDQRNIVLRTS
jgi:hypothetical protein